MKYLVLVSIALAFMLLFGCAGQQAAPPAQQPAAPAPAPEPVKNVTHASAPAPFKPLHLSYLFSLPGPSNAPAQKISVDYYFDEKTTCGNRPALNGFMTASQQGQQGVSYNKITLYLDTGEAVYSERMDEQDIAFDTATPVMPDFDPAFYLQTLAARGNKALVSDEIWNATKPVLLKSIAAFGANGDYSISAGGSKTVAGLDCKEFTLSVKASNSDGQMLLCVHRLADAGISFVTSGAFPGEVGNAPSWQLVLMSREKPEASYYPQCLAPVSCIAVEKPSQSNRDSCGAQGKAMETDMNKQNCVTAYNCITYEEQARKRVTQSQQPSCAVDEKLVSQAADCWRNNGNVEFVYVQQSGCLKELKCNPQQQ